MNLPLASVFACALVSALPGDPPRSTNSLEFADGGKVEVSYNQINLGGGITLQNLMARSEIGTRVRQIFNERAFMGRIAGRLTVATSTEIAGNALEPGAYQLSFRIDEQLAWSLVVLTPGGEEVFAAPLDTRRSDAGSAKRLVIRPSATDNKKGAGQLEIRFGELSASAGFTAAAAGERK